MEFPIERLNTILQFPGRRTNTSWNFLGVYHFLGNVPGLLYGVISMGLTCTAATGRNKNAPPTGAIISSLLAWVKYYNFQ